MSPLVAVLWSTVVSAWRGGAMPIMAGLLAAVLLWLPRVSGGDEVAVWQIGLGAGQALLLLGIGWLAVDSISRDLRDGQASLLATVRAEVGDEARLEPASRGLEGYFLELIARLGDAGGAS